MSIWEEFNLDDRERYIRFLQIYASLSKLFNQKKANPVPYLDSKFQETIFARVFGCQNVDINNTPHDILAVINGKSIGIAVKTWMYSKQSFQKVMQIKSFQDEINQYDKDNDAINLIKHISKIRNEKLVSDYNRLGLTEGENIYHYITRESTEFIINETSYPLVNPERLKIIGIKSNAIEWSDGIKDYKYTFGDSQIWQKFNSDRNKYQIVQRFNVKIIDDPFSLLLGLYEQINETKEDTSNIYEVFLPLYSFRSKDVEPKSGLNAWNAAPKSKSSIERPLNEIYIPIPREFHIKYPDFFTEDIFSFEKLRNEQPDISKKPKLRFHLCLPSGKKIPALVTSDNMKALQSGSDSEVDENGKRYGQSALGQWLLIDVLGLKERKLVTRSWLEKKDTDSVRLWRKKGDYNIINIDFAPFGSFESFMDKE